MAIAIGIDQIGTGSGTAIATASATTQASGSIFVVAGAFNGTFTSVTDSKSNTYSIIGAERVVDTGSSSGRCYYVENGTGGASHTFTLTDNSATIKTVLVAEITGALTSGALDVANSATDASSPFTVSVTPTAGVRMLVAAFFGDTAGATTNAESSGFTVLTTANLADGSTYWAGCLAYRIVTADGSTPYTVSFTQTSANEGGVWLAAFKEAPTYSLEQAATAFGDDDGNESSHTIGTQGADYSGNLGVKTLRFLINATLDPPALALTLRAQKNGAGGFLQTATSSTSLVTPVIEAADCTVSGSNTASTSWAVSHPAASTGDLLIFGIAWDDSTTTSDVTEPAGPNGETLIEINATPVTDSGTETRLKGWYCVATGSWSASTLTFTPAASESWSASCIKIPAGEFDATTPIGAVGTASDSGGGTDTTVDSPAFSAGSTDGGGKLVWFASVDADPLGAVGSGWTSLQTQDLGAVAHGIAVRDTAVTNSESISSTTWAIAGDSWASLAYIIRAPTITNQTYISASANVAAAAADATTSRLTGGGGSFTAGWRSDDTNPLPNINMGSGGNTEVEFVVTTQSPAVSTDYFEYRMYAGSVAFGTYTDTPRWTISTGSTGTGAITLGAIDVDGSGSVVGPTTGTGAIVLGAMTVSGTGEREVVDQGGSVELTLPAITVSGSGSVGGSVTGTGSITLGPITVSGTAERSIPGTGAIVLGALQAAGAGERTETGSGAITLGPIVVAGSGAIGGEVGGSGAVTLGPIAVSGSGAREQAAQGALLLPAITVDGAGQRNETGTGAIALGALIVAAAANRSYSGTGAIMLGAMQVAGFEEPPIDTGIAESIVLFSRRKGRR